MDRAISAKAMARRRRTGGARGYSVVVRWLKILLPLAALATLSLLFLISRSNFTGGFVLSKEDMALLGEGLKLDGPRFTGATDRGEPFTISAAWALPDKPDPTLISLNDVLGEIDLIDGRVAKIVAGSGEMRTRDRQVSLQDGVTLTTSDGYKVETATADIDLTEWTMQVPDKIVGTGAEGRLEAASMRAWREDDGESGYVARFEGGVRVVFSPRTTQNDDGAATGPSLITDEGKAEK